MWIVLLRLLRAGLGLVVVVLGGSAYAFTDGDFDTSFGDGSGFQVTTPAPSYLFNTYDLAVGPDGSLTASGTTLYDAPNSYDLTSCLLSADGAFDNCTSFGFDLGGSNEDRDNGGVAYTPDGKRILAGFAVGPAADPRYRIGFLALEPTNDLHTEFGQGGRLLLEFPGNAFPMGVTVQRNGDIVFAGYFNHEPSSPGTGVDCVVGRLLPGGAPDPGFGAGGLQTIGWDQGGPSTDECNAVATYPDGRVVAAGFAEPSPQDLHFALARLTALGEPDPDFGSGGKLLVPLDDVGGQWGLAKAVAVDRKNRVIAAGTFSTGHGSRFVVVRTTEAGELDGSFHGTGKVDFSVSGNLDDALTGVRLAILPPPSNDVVVIGTYQSAVLGTGVFVAVLRDDGTFDTSFHGTGLNAFSVPSHDPAGYSGGLAIQGGRIVVAGGFNGGTPDQSRLWVGRFNMHQISGDDFESGDLRFWSSQCPEVGTGSALEDECAPIDSIHSLRD